ncbi:unnamed protein product [Adineta ricciae]|uniref:G-protein coupled receptors family 1 profile domain-containing protein n=1 Tax=Adineta ricciae TaxID=249248 RepID=A0A815UVB9_ADIRI|nr:unnamed protein product [Adineta ricciae]CAF1629079.1 unnamed protein product [Adineta ricciae]
MEDITIKLAQILLPIIILIGFIGNSLNILILTRSTLKKHACSHYFLSLASNNLIYSFVLIHYFLANRYNINGQLFSLVSCKILTFLNNLCSLLSPYFIVLASIDRYFASSSNVHMRQWSTKRIARRLILLTVLSCTLISIHDLILTDLRPDIYGCSLPSNTNYNKFFIIFRIILYTSVPPCLMIIFGLLTIYNTTRSQINRQVTVRYRRTESQLLRILLVQVITYIILNMPLSIIYLMLSLPTGYIPTSKLFFAFRLVSFPFHFSFATPFFLYILSSSIYKEELIQLIFKLLHRRQIHPIRNLFH